MLFEQVLNFLRDGVLPDDEETLRGMYNEAAFFRLGLLKKHVESKFQEIAKKRHDIYEQSIQGVPALEHLESQPHLPTLCTRSYLGMSTVVVPQQPSPRQVSNVWNGTIPYTLFRRSKYDELQHTDPNDNEQLSASRDGRTIHVPSRPNATDGRAHWPILVLHGTNDQTRIYGLTATAKSVQTRCQTHLVTTRGY